MHALDIIHATNALSGIAFVALGIAILVVRARDAANISFAAYALAWGGSVFIVNLLIDVQHSTPPAIVARTAFQLLAVAGLLAFVAVYPNPIRRADRPAMIGALAVAIIAVLVRAGSIVVFTTPNAEATPVTSAAVQVSRFVFGPGVWAALAFLTFRWKHVDGPSRQKIGFVYAAAVLWPAFATGDTLMLEAMGRVDALLVPAILPIALSSWWLSYFVRHGGRTPRNAAWLTLGAILAAMLERFLVPDAPDLWGYGVTRLAGVAIIAYGIVRHQLLGIELKIRWGLSKTTVAAVFIAVFFIASEAAQQFLGDQLGSTYIGIGAAGLLVFAIAPLQRAAERLAAKAVPVSPSVRAGRAEGDLTALRHVARRLASDGTVSAEDHRALAVMAEQLGLGAVDVADVLADAKAPAAGSRRRR